MPTNPRINYMMAPDGQEFSRPQGSFGGPGMMGNGNGMAGQAGGMMGPAGYPVMPQQAGGMNDSSVAAAQQMFANAPGSGGGTSMGQRQQALAGAMGGAPAAPSGPDGQSSWGDVYGRMAQQSQPGAMGMRPMGGANPQALAGALRNYQGQDMGQSAQAMAKGGVSGGGMPQPMQGGMAGNAMASPMGGPPSSFAGSAGGGGGGGGFGGMSREQLSNMTGAGWANGGQAAFQKQFGGDTAAMNSAINDYSPGGSQYLPPGAAQRHPNILNKRRY